MITSFSGPYRFLSNFYPGPVDLSGVSYPSVEHAYVAAKTLDMNLRAKIRATTSPGAVKRLGRSLELRPDWEFMKLGLMKSLVHDKFALNPALGLRLIQTGDLQLIEGNTWGDTYWGVCNGVGENHLGLILMDVRRVLKRWNNV